MAALPQLLAAAASPSPCTKLDTGATASKVVTSPTCTTTATGGFGAKTYAWTRVSGSTSITAATASAAATTFSATCTRDLGPVTAVFRCTVTDGSGTTTVDVSVSLEYATA